MNSRAILKKTIDLENRITKVLEEPVSKKFGDKITKDFILMPTTEYVNKIGRPPKEVCHRPVWKKKDNSKTRADQIESKVTTGKVIINCF